MPLNVARFALYASGLLLFGALAGGGPFACNLDVAVPSGAVDLDIVADGGLDGATPDVLVVAGKGVGEACAAKEECRHGLTCEAGECQPGGSSVGGTPCLLSVECGAGLFCSYAGVCAPAGDGAVGAACASGADCLPTHVCDLAGFSGACALAGTADVGQPCERVTDCFAGLRCGDDGTCQAASALFGAPFFEGASCVAGEDELGPKRFYFEVPRAGDAGADFYRLPFPNDARLRADGRVDLSGHPVPGPGLVGVDLVARLVDAIEHDMTGWSTNPTIVFRASAWIDTKTVVATGEARTVRMVDLTAGSPDYGRESDLGWFATTSRDRYVCPNSLRLHRPWSRPLAPGATYAVLLTSGIRSAATKDATGRDVAGGALAPDADFSAMLAAEPPSDDDLTLAWEAYRPLRDWMPQAGIGATDLVGGTVFTTARVRDGLPRFRRAIDARPAPAFSSWAPCVAGASSPCDDGLSGEEHVRGCFTDDADFYEVHARVSLPMFQDGARPYLAPADGGDVRFDGEQAHVVADELVCVALTVPKGLPMPEAGWPLVLYAHGTGGTFRSHVTEGLAGLVAQIDEGGPSVGFAVLGYDQVMHGERRNSHLSPETLVYNFANPKAARGNLYQAAADNLALVKALKAAQIPADVSPTGAEVRFDATRIYFVGHSQGGTSGPLALPFEPDVPVAVYSGAGGSLVLSLVNKTAPVPILEGVKLALQDPEVGSTHAVLGLAQMYFDAVDPLNYAALQFASPGDGLSRRHVLQSYGLGDSYTPPDCIKALAGAMHVTLAEPVLDGIGGVAKATPPIKGNWAGTTGVTVEYQPQGYDGHFVLFRDEDARRQLRGFLASAVRDGVPTLGP